MELETSQDFDKHVETLIQDAGLSEKYVELVRAVYALGITVGRMKAIEDTGVLSRFARFVVGD